MATLPDPNPDIEPDEEWKRDLRIQIEKGLQDMVDDARKSLDAKLKEAPVDEAERERLAKEHTTTMRGIRNLAAEQFTIGLERERQERRWATNIQMAPGWNEALVKEQQSILHNIQKDDSQSEKSSHRATSISPSDDRGQWGGRANPKSQHEPSSIPSIPHRGADPHSNQDDNGFVLSARNTTPKGVNGSPSGERPSERWSNQSLVEEPEDMDLSVDERPMGRRMSRPERTFERPIERSVRSPEVVDLTWRPPASTPPKPHPMPEFWKPTMSPSEDVADSRRNITRRGSAASIESIRSTTYRSPMPSQIPERPDESIDVVRNSERERVRTQASEQEWKSLTKAREKERQGPVVGGFRQSSAGEASNLRREEHLVLPMSSMRAAESHSRAYQPPSRPITSQQSSQNLRADEPYVAPPISPSRPAEPQSRIYPSSMIMNSQPSQNHRAEEPTYMHTSVPISPSRPVEPQSRMHPPSSARPIPKKRSSQNIDFDETLPSPGITAWQPESPVQPYGLPPPAIRSVASKPSFILEDPSRFPQISPTARTRPTPTRSPADARFEPNVPRSALPDDESRWQTRGLKPRTSRLDDRYDQPDLQYVDRRRHTAEDSDDEYGDLVERRVVDVEPQTRRRTEGSSKWDEEAKRREAARLREQAARLEEELLEEERMREEEERRREEAQRRKEQRAELMREEEENREAEARRREKATLREAELRKMEEDARRLEEEARRKEEDAKRKEEEARRKEEEAKVKEEEAKVKEAEARRKELEARRKEMEAKRKEDAARQKEEETRKKEVEIRKREEEVKRREEDLSRREAEAEAKRKDQEKQDLRQEEFRKREEEIRRRADERKRQDSIGSHSEGRDRAGSTTYSSASPTTPSSPWSGPNRSGSTATNSTDRSSTSSWSSTASSAWTSSTRPSSTSSPTAHASTANRTPMTPTTPTTPTGAKAGHPAGQQPPSPAPVSEAEWARRQAEQAKKQQEQFRLEQERLERERQAKAGRILSKEEVIQLFETHHRQWAQLYTFDALHWDSFPWPMLKRPYVPDELTTTAIGAYVLSPHYPADVAKASKDRIKEHIKRWHPDRFETKLLPKVIEGEREKVKQGAGLVARCLNDLLTRSNVTTIFS